MFSVRPRIDCHTHIISPAIRDEYFHRTQGFALVMQLPSSLMENPQCIQTVLSDPRLFCVPVWISIAPSPLSSVSWYPIWMSGR